MKKQIKFVFRTNDNQTVSVEPNALKAFVRTRERSKLPGKLVRIEAPQKLLASLSRFVKDISEDVTVDESGEVSYHAAIGFDDAIVILVVVIIVFVLGFAGGFAQGYEDGKNTDKEEGGDEEEDDENNGDGEEK